MAVGPVYHGTASTLRQAGVGPTFAGNAQAQRQDGTGPTYQGTAQALRQAGVGPTFAGEADQQRNAGTGPTFHGEADALRANGVGPVFHGDANALRAHGVGPVYHGSGANSASGPLIDSITPIRGLTVGETCVTIRGLNFAVPSAGGFVRVYFNNVLALEAGAIDDSTIIALTPPGLLGTVDVRVENWSVGPPESLTGSFTLPTAFTYVRPNIETNRDKAFSEDSALLVVTRELVAQMRNGIIENVHHDMHPEYADAVSLALAGGIEKQAEAPSLKVIGPTTSEDRFYALNGRFALESVAGTPNGAQFKTYHQPVTVRLDYQFVGVGRSKGEALNLWNALTLWLDRTPDLVIPIDGNDKANGTLAFELNPTWEQRGEFKVTTRQGFYQFSGEFHLRGVHTISRELCEGRGADEILPTYEQIP